MRFISLSLCCFGLLLSLLPLVVQGEVASFDEFLRSESATLIQAQPGEEIILPALRGLEVVADASAPASTAADGSLVVASDVPAILHSEGFNIVVEGALGQPVSVASLRRMEQAVRLALSAAGQPYSLVYFPEQDITDGHVRLVVRESRVGAISVEGNRYFPMEDYLERLLLHPGDAVEQAQLTAALGAIRRNGYRDATIKVERGAEPGTTDVVIVARERKPRVLNFGYNNDGTASTDEDRLVAGYTWGALLGTDHTASLQWSSDPSARHSRALSGSYNLPLAAGRSLTLLGAYSELDSIVAFPLDQSGTNWQVGLNYDRTLPTLGERYRQHLQIGLDFKSSDNNLNYVLPPLIFAITNNLTHVVQARATYTGTYLDNWGQTRATAQLVGAPGGVGDYNTDTAFGGTRYNASADYVYGRLNLFRETRLPGLLEGWDWRVRGTYQISSTNLLGSEQLAVGGSTTLRGYPTSAVLGDEGVILSTELELPPLALLAQLGVETTGADQLDLFGFVDYAHTWSRDPLPGESGIEAASAGLGLRYQWSNHLRVSLSQGWQLKDVTPRLRDADERFSISLSFSY